MVIKKRRKIILKENNNRQSIVAKVLRIKAWLTIKVAGPPPLHPPIRVIQQAHPLALDKRASKQSLVCSTTRQQANTRWLATGQVYIIAIIPL